MLGKPITLSAAALSLGLFAAPVSAAPSAIIGANVTADASAVEQIARRCHRHHGRWHCDSRSRVHGYVPSVDVRIGRDRRHGHHHRRNHRD